jgi:hypothetical protein
VSRTWGEILIPLVMLGILVAGRTFLALPDFHQQLEQVFYSNAKEAFSL